ncbi:MAG: DUF4124 domain-containing protein [Nitrospinae bacterium]|nr:DUF4124 domain-containing protein [Nitrospinota bacterium]MBL7019535.1 DUF4124 domain-containing protein [Nitrospinaceae bacterium]
MLARQAMSILIIFALIWVVDADATIYKWKDEKGKTHFTDDPTRVPEAFRKKPFIKGSTTPPKPQKTERGKAQVEGGGISEKKEGAKNEIKEGGKQEGLTEAERSAIEAAVSFLKEDIPRYEKYYTYPPSRSKFRFIKLAVAGATTQKQSMLDQVSQHDLPLLESFAGFLKTSIAEDEKSQKVMPTTIVSTRQTQTLMNRLKSETEQEKQLLEKLTTALNAQNIDTADK